MFVPESVERKVMSDKEYFGPTMSDYISNSKLTLINPKQGGSVSKYKKGFEESNNESFRLGSAIHGLLLEPDLFKLSTITAPSGLARTVIDTTFKLVNREVNPLEFDAALDHAIVTHNYYKGAPGEKRRQALIDSTKEYYDYLGQSKGAEFGEELLLNATQKATAIACVSSIQSNPEGIALLRDPIPMEAAAVILPEERTHQYFNEDVFLCEYKIDDKVYKMKSKIDAWSIDFETKTLYLNDLKTTGANVELFMGTETVEIRDYATMMFGYMHGSFHKYHYYRQMYMYLAVLKLHVGREFNISLADWTIKVNMVVVETIKPHQSKVFVVTDELLEAGRIEFEFLMQKVHRDLDQHELYTSTATVFDGFTL